MKDYTEQEILEAIKDCNGIIYNIAKRLGCCWNTAKTYVDKYESCSQAFKEEEESAIDRAESVMHEMIQNKDGQMVRYFLSTKGKKRGYTEKQEIEHSGNIPVNIVIEGIKPETSDS